MVVQSLKKAERATIRTSIVILGLSLAKTIVGFLSGSLVLLTDGVHSFTDLVTNAASITGLRIAQREPDERFPYGYFKAESLSALFISLFILYLAYEFLIGGINALGQAPVLNHPLITLVTAASSILVSYLLARYLIGKGRATNSQSLIANGREKRVDVVTSSVVLLALILSFLKAPYVEGVVTIIISLFIFWEGFESVRDAVFSLMDISPSKDKEKLVIKALSEVPGVEGFGNLKLRKAGPIILGEVDVMVRKRVSVKRARKLCVEIERRASELVPELRDLAVKVYPYKPAEQFLVMPVKKKGEDPWLSKEFGRSDYFYLVKVKGGDVIGEEFVSNPYKDESVKAGLRAANLLLERGVDVVIVKNIGEISYHVLSDSLISVYETRKRKAATALEAYFKGELTAL